ncbi:MAG: hypothetical protein MJ048_03585 [Acidaminococcaceae bacterium]|nr:hypothetical protein [Acidaminococcaceae bacterium]MDO4935712.1 hypothetical protein [Phascolarctobacterium sp.]
MKKILIALLLTLIPLTALGASKNYSPADVAKAESSGDFVITSDVRHFNPLTGIYDLNGHVYVQLPVHEEQLKINADTAQVKLYSQEVNAKGNIELEFGEMLFRCDSTYVSIKERTAYVYNNIFFKHKFTEIRADSATYCWKTKLATFKNASYNGEPKKANLQYNVMTGKVIK